MIYETKGRLLRGKPAFHECVECGVIFGYNVYFWPLSNKFIQKLPL